MQTGLSRAFLTVVLVGGLGYLTGCRGISEVHNCNDGIDNDGDGLVDNHDPGCPFTGGNDESPDPVACNDGVDNDGDGLIDVDDPGCTTSDTDDDEFHVPQPACLDGVDNDSDGLTDFPADPGCFLPLEDGEDDDCPDGENCPACSNGMDDDGDGVADYPADPGCANAASFDEFNLDPDACGGDLAVELFPEQGELVGTVRPGRASALESSVCGGEGPESVWVVRVLQPSTLLMTTNHPTTTADTIIYFRRDCQDDTSEIACNDDANDFVTSSEILIDVPEPGTYYLVVDSSSVGTMGGFRARINYYTLTGDPCEPAVPTCAPGQSCRPIYSDSFDSFCLPPQCTDGFDNDRDGFTDYPFEPGCLSPTDITEADDCPGGPNCPECGNETDDDLDGVIDFPLDVLGCTAASDGNEADECIEGAPVLMYPIGGVSGTTPPSSSGQNHFTGSCETSTSTFPTEVIYGLRVDQNLASLTISTEGSPEDTLLHIRHGQCDNPTNEVGCADPGVGGETITLDNPEQGLYFVFVDGDFAAEVDYVLNITGKIAAGNSCDPASAIFTCDVGYTCDVSSHICRPSQCNNTTDDDGDGLMDYPNDPGCASVSDDSEADDCPTGPTCPACSNDVDDDYDNIPDYGTDPGCEAAGDTDEIDACIPGIFPTLLTLDGVTGKTPLSTVGSKFKPSCHTSTTSTEDVYYLPMFKNLASLTFSTEGSAGDTVLSVRYGTCGNAMAEVACAQLQNGGESVTVQNPMQGLYYVFVDGDFVSNINYVLNVSGTIGPNGTCDPTDTHFTCQSGYYCDTASLTCQVAACANSMDDDGDLRSDYPGDPGCDTPSDNSETDDCPAGPMCPICSNTTDDDADGLIDYPGDYGCLFAADNDERDCVGESDPISVVTTRTSTGTTTGATSDFRPSCSATSTAPDKVHLLRFPGRLTTLVVNTDGSVYDTVMMIKRTECTAQDLACDDDSGAGTQSRIALSNVAPGQYVIIVDGYGSNAGNYTLNISGTIASGEACDPAQVTDGMFACATGTACVDLGTGYKCQ